MVEEAGIPTVALATLRPVVERLQYPRAALVRFPRGATVGAPHDIATQQTTLRGALRLLESTTGPGEIVKLDASWAGEEHE